MSIQHILDAIEELRSACAEQDIPAPILEFEEWEDGMMLLIRDGQDLGATEPMSDGKLCAHVSGVMVTFPARTSNRGVVV